MIEKIHSSVYLAGPKFAFIFCSVALLLFCSAAMSEAFKLPDTGQYGA